MFITPLMTLIVPLLFASGVTWLYPLLLLGAIAFPVYQIITTLLSSSAKLTALTTGGKAPTGAVTTVACPHCGGIVSHARFCGLCGKEMIVKPVVETCSSCGDALRPGTKFLHYLRYGRCLARQRQKPAPPRPVAQIAGPR